MDEAEKYQQRLQAIAEKRRLQEEHDQAKRQLEDEKLRMQQLKRKSLRDQWLMEGPPLSPGSAGPRSPLWGTQAQQIEANINKLQSEVVEKTHKHKEDCPTSAQSHTDHHGNGKRASAVTPPPSGSSDNRDEKSEEPAHDMSLTNGTGQDKKSRNAPSQHVNDISKGVETLLFLGYTEAEPGQGLCDDDDDDDASAVIRAERVIITEEGEEVNEESQDMQAKEEEVEEEEPEEEREEEEAEREKRREGKGQEEREEKEEEREEEQEKEKVEEPEEGIEKGQVEEREEEQEEGIEKGQAEEREEDQENKPVEEREEENTADVENHLEMSTESGEVTELEEDLRHTHEDTTVKITKQADEETSTNTDAVAGTKPVKDSATKSALNSDLTPDADPAAATAQETAAAETHPQSLSETPEGTVHTPAVSSTLPASALNPNGAQKSLGPTSSSTNPAAQFQEIPLDGGMVEEEPLLATKVEPLTDASNPNQAEGAKTKTCQCCSVM